MNSKRRVPTPPLLCKRQVLCCPPLGWFALEWWGRQVAALTLAHPDPQAAIAALDPTDPPPYPVPPEQEAPSPTLARRLQAYAAGLPDLFHDVPLALEHLPPFQRAVLLACRQIPYGQTTRYAQLAAALGKPSAARAVGNALARNPLPILIPCHRVIGARGAMSGFSAPGGLATKRQLLAIEARWVSDGRFSLQ